MAKKVFANTNIKHNNEYFEAGTELDTDKFTREQLRELYDVGAVEIREVEDPKSEEKSNSEEKPEEKSEPTPMKATKAAPTKAVGPDTSVKAPSA